ncbi:hypothetical protein, partial [Enterobacter intestinihominis]
PPDFATRRRNTKYLLRCVGVVYVYIILVLINLKLMKRVNKNRFHDVAIFELLKPGIIGIFYKMWGFDTCLGSGVI